MKSSEKNAVLENVTDDSNGQSSQSDIYRILLHALFLIELWFSLVCKVSCNINVFFWLGSTNNLLLRSSSVASQSVSHTGTFEKQMSLL